ncbi:MAG: hypothetical protein M1532_01135 [Nitrospirae bacterium]|nr:hypothetical protein [Nitrospirota bacterium]
MGRVDVGHDKARIQGQGGIPVFPGYPALPEVSRNVHLDAASVSLVPDLSGPVFHHLKPGQGLLDGGVSGDSVSGENGDDSAGIAFLGRKAKRSRRALREAEGREWTVCSAFLS